MYNFRTDLALERTDLYKKINNVKGDIDGIISEEVKVSELIKNSPSHSKPWNTTMVLFFCFKH